MGEMKKEEVIYICITT